MIDVSTTDAWRQLERLSRRAPRLRDAFRDDPDRARRFSREAAGLLVDFSKNRIDDAIFAALCNLARTVDLEGHRAAMLAGEPVNTTERRAALHVALRDRSGRAYGAGAADRSRLVGAELSRLKSFCNDVHAGAIRGFSGQPLDVVVNVGIGGSDLGPEMAVEALRSFHIAGRRTLFVSNVDGQHLNDALAGLDPARTLFVIASKTFTTEETMTNAHSARRWFLESGAGENAVARHFVAVSTNAAAVATFGIDPARTFGFWDWVGGRFSLWSAIGISIALQIGFERFERLLDGAHAMDEHFRAAPIEENIPVLLALVGIWNRNFLGAAAHAVLPYDQHLRRLPAYLQQAEMESNGKSRRRDGAPVDCPTAPVIFGEPGTNGQHAFYQLLHQGTDLVSADFILAARSSIALGDHHERLVAHCLAQMEALMAGRTEDEARSGSGNEDQDRLAAHRAFPGDRPTTAILMDRLDPESLGALIALYEHKIFCQGVIWGINSFDQWGVELGKTLAARLLPKVARLGAPAVQATGHDASTNQLLDWINARRARGDL